MKSSKNLTVKEGEKKTNPCVGNRDITDMIKCSNCINFKECDVKTAEKIREEIKSGTARVNKVL